MASRTALLTSLALVACDSSGPSGPPISPGASVVDCATNLYPADVAEPMALGEVIAPYRWPDASLRTNDALVSVDLAQAPCALDDDIEWSPFDVLLFVSVPAW